MHRFIVSGVLVAGLLIAPLAHAKSSSFKVANHAGATLTAIYSGPSGRADWGPNILDKNVADGGGVSITLDGLDGCKYDFRYDFDGRPTFEEYEVDVCAIDGAQFEIK